MFLVCFNRLKFPEFIQNISFTMTGKISQQDKALREFWNNHGTRFELQTLYTLNAITYENDSSKVVLVQNRIKPENQEIESYEDYMNEVNDRGEKEGKYEEGAYFNLMHQICSGESLFTSQNKRFFGARYSSQIFVSTDQKYVAIKRKEGKKVTESKFDIFTGFDDEKFFEPKPFVCNRENGEYVATLVTTNKKVTKLTFDVDKKFCALYSSAQFDIFDLTQASSAAINEDPNDRRVQLYPTLSMKSNENVTYDKILGIFVGVGSDIDAVYQHSWIAFQSKMFSLVHFVGLDTCRDYQAKKINHEKLLKKEEAGEQEYDDNTIFFEDKQDIKVPINSVNQDPVEFWTNTECLFSINGIKAIVNTPSDVFQINLEDIEGKPPAKRTEKISQLRNKILDTYLYGADDFIFVEKDMETREMQFWHTDPEITADQSELVDATIDIAAFDLKSWKLLEVVTLKDKTCRAIGVRGSEQVYIWEKTKAQTEQQYFEDMFPTNLSAVSMPYYAYSLGGGDVYIVPMFEEDLTLAVRLQLEEQEEIQRLLFSSNADLFVITRKTDVRQLSKYSDFIAYKIQVDDDLAFRIGCSEKTIKLAKAKKEAQSTLLGDQTAETEMSAKLVVEDKKQVERKKPSITKFGPFKLRSLIEMDRKKEKETDLDEIFVHDLISGAQSRLDFTILAEFKLYFVSFNYNSEEIKLYDKHNVVDVMGKKGDPTKIAYLNMLNEKAYVFQQEGGTSIKGLNIKDDKTLYKVANLYTEYTYTVLRAQTDQQKIYLLLEDAAYYYLRIFIFKNQTQLEQSAFIKIEETPKNLKFIETFYTAREIIDGVLIHDETSISRIYDFKEYSSIQHFDNYLPASSKADRTLMTSKIIQSKHDRRLGLIFNYPKSGAPKIAVFLPYLNDNVIPLTGASTTQLSWIAHTKQSVLRNGVEQMETCSRIFQFNFTKMQLQEFDLSGICVNISNYKVFRTRKILSICDATPKFLITTQDGNFLKKLRLLWIKNSHKLKPLYDWDTTQLFCEQEPGKPKLVLYNELYAHQKQGFTFKFEVNERQDFVVACIKDNIIKRMFFVQSEFKNKFFDVIIEEPQTEKKEQKSILGLTDVFKKGVQEKLLNEDDDEEESKDPSFLGKAFGFELSETKIIVWSTYQIFYKDFADKKTDGTIKLNTSEFTMFSHEFQQWKQANLGKDLKQDDEEDNAAYESTIVEVYTRNEEITGEETAKTDIVQIKVKVSGSATLLMSFDLDTNAQISSFMTTAEAEVFYDTYDKCYVYDKNGITKLDSGETYFEYHTSKKEEDLDHKVNPGVVWGERMVPAECGVLLLIGSKLILPYSYLSYVLDSTNLPEDLRVQDAFFYTDDYYKIKGRNILHKYKYEPEILEKIMDCYWKLDSFYILSVLVPTAKVVEIDTQAFNDKKKAEKEKVKPALKTALVEGDYKAPQILQVTAPENKEPKFQEGEVKMIIENGNNIVKELLEVSYDKLINQILYMLSQLPLQYSFKLLQENFAELSEYSRFPDHLNKWFDQTDQLMQVRVIYTELEQGNEEFRSNMSLLDSTFFEQFPTKPPRKEEKGKDAEEDQITFCSKIAGTLRSLWTTEKEPEKRMIPVRISMVRTDWMFQEDGKKFFEALLQNDDITLFQNVHLQNIIEFQWRIFLPCYRRRVWLPFFLLCYIPFMVLALFNKTDENGEPVMDWSKYVAIPLLSLYGLWKLENELREISSNGIKEYFTNLENLFDFTALSIILASIILTITSYSTSLSLCFDAEGVKTDCDPLNPDIINVKEQRVQTLRLVYVWGILIQTIMLLNYVKVFDFWATFVRSLVQIFKSAVPLGATLFLIIFTNSLIYFVLSRNNGLINDENQTVERSDYFTILINSYRLALGDFNIENDFATSPNTIVFWLMFFINTVVMLLIMLNMVVAVMSAAFDEVSATNEANIYKAKLQAIQAYKFLITYKYQDKQKSNKYLYLLEIDPVVDDLGETFNADLPEQQMNKRMDEFRKEMKTLNNEIISVKNSCKLIQKKVEQLVEPGNAERDSKKDQ